MTEEPASSSASSPPSSPVASVDATAAGYMQLWADSLVQVLTQVAGSPFPVECVPEIPPGFPPAEENDLRVILVAAGGLRGEMSLRIPRAAVIALAQVFLSEAQNAAAEFKPDHQEAVEELLRQVAGHAATALRAHWGEVQLRLQTGTPPSWSAGASGWMVSRTGSACLLALEWQLSAALHVALAVVHPPESRPGESTPDHGLAEGNFELLKDVELEVTLRFGERNMLLREILELGEGSVIELDREVQEPVDLLLDGKLIARGEVVIVDGNYGLRVQEVVHSVAAG
jgi:flagellar motor switch protein FliN